MSTWRGPDEGPDGWKGGAQAKGAPCSIADEAVLIGFMLSQPCETEALRRIIGVCHPLDFYSEAFSWIALGVREIWSPEGKSLGKLAQYVAPVLERDRLKALALEVKAEYRRSLEGEPNCAILAAHRVADAAYRRHLIEASGEIMRTAFVGSVSRPQLEDFAARAVAKAGHGWYEGAE